jgi:hypothetical protein
VLGPPLAGAVLTALTLLPLAALATGSRHAKRTEADHEKEQVGARC